MKIVETTFERLPRERLEIGFKGENLRATVRIDCASVFAEYPNATPTLIVKPLFADAYPVVVDRNGTDVDWLITSEILSFSGDGEIQLVFYKDQVICKSAVSKIRVSRSLQVTGEKPDPIARWEDAANRKLAEVDAQIVELEGMVDTATDAATRAEQSASTASTKAEQAAGSAATATEKATEATNAAGTATAKAAEAALSATQANNSAVSAADSERGAMAKAEQAARSALSASTDATLATEAAQTATAKAGESSASAQSAQASATDAASSATAASASETAAKASETAASTSATQAAQSVQDAGTAAQTAMQKAAEASQSATNAETSATNAATSAETASTKAGEAAASAQAASDAKTAVEETAEQLAESLEQIEQNTQDIADLDERKANIDGYYPDMTVGNAEQLNSSKYVENSEPYTFRTSGGSSDIGNREYLDAVVGGTVAWNQLVPDADGGEESITITLESGKKYLARLSGTDSMLLGSGQEITAAKGADNVFDLTQMFGTAVADYVYGQGASFFRKWFGDSHYPYNAGELLSVEELQSHDMVGFNQWDEEWELGLIAVATGANTGGNGIRSKNMCRCVPNTVYNANVPYTYTKYIFWYDATGNFISPTSIPNSGSVTSPSDACYFRIRVDTITTYKNDICISLAHNGSRNGEYAPYTKHSYPLDSTVILRGIPKVGANGVYWDGDRYLPDGTVERRYGVVDLGTLTWNTGTSGGHSYFRCALPNTAKIGTNAIFANEYIAVTTGVWSTAFPDKAAFLATTNWGSTPNLAIRDDSFTDVTAFKAAMQGVLLIYELVTPTTETAQPYHSTQWVSDWGTEEFVSTGIVPVGSETRYPANLRDKLQHLPDAASGNGSYLITQTDGQMVLTPFPAPPSTAGNYVLKATVTGGVATYTWEVAT